MAQVALAWVLQKDGVSAPIVGSTSLENLKDLIGTYSDRRSVRKLTRSLFARCRCGAAEAEPGGGEEPGGVVPAPRAVWVYLRGLPAVSCSSGPLLYAVLT